METEKVEKVMAVIEKVEKEIAKSKKRSLVMTLVGLASQVILIWLFINMDQALMAGVFIGSSLTIMGLGIAKWLSR